MIYLCEQHLHHEVISMVDKNVFLLLVPSVSLSEVDFDFVFGSRCARRDYRESLRRIIRASVAGGVQPALESGFSGGVSDKFFLWRVC